MAAVVKKIEIEVPIQKVYEVITDFESYPQFLTGMKSVDVLKKGANALEVEFKLEIVKQITYTLAVVLKPNEGFSWSFVKGDYMKSNDGFWKLEEIDKKRTQATYTIEVGLGFLVPKMIVGSLIEKNLPVMLDEFKLRCEGKK